MPSFQLEINQVSKVFRTGLSSKTSKEILKNISFQVQRGETFGIMGESGSGKTTLGKIIAGIEIPTEGKVLFNGNNIFRLKNKSRAFFRKKVQMVFQNPESSLNPRKRIGKSFEEVLRLTSSSKTVYQNLIQKTLATVGLSDEIFERYPHQLSGGENQRIALGRVLLLEPEFIILDEPTSALDISVTAQILHLLKDIQEKKGLGYILISHEKETVKFMSHKIGRIENGTLVY